MEQPLYLNTGEMTDFACKMPGVIVELAECLKNYGEYSQVQLENAKHNQSLSHPVREVATSCFVKH